MLWRSLFANPSPTPPISHKKPSPVPSRRQRISGMRANVNWVALCTFPTKNMDCSQDAVAKSYPECHAKPWVQMGSPTLCNIWDHRSVTFVIVPTSFVLPWPTVREMSQIMCRGPSRSSVISEFNFNADTRSWAIRGARNSWVPKGFGIKKTYFLYQNFHPSSKCLLARS